MNLFKILTDHEWIEGASHMDDLSYLFSSQYLQAPPMNSEGHNAIKRMVIER